jgi:hypothetical protein
MGPGPEVSAEAREIWRVIREHLPAEQYLVLFLHFAWGMSLVSIAHLLLETDSTIRNRKRDALRRLRVLCKDWGWS